MGSTSTTQGSDKMGSTSTTQGSDKMGSTSTTQGGHLHYITPYLVLLTTRIVVMMVTSETSPYHLHHPHPHYLDFV